MTNEWIFGFKKMYQKIGLEKDKSIIFMGTMNAMPMMYALELKEQGYDVYYFVDVHKRNVLSRPEHHYPDITYPYPPWVIEFVIPSQVFLAMFPRFFAALYRLRLKRVTNNKAGCFVLNGLFTALTPYLSKTAKKVGLSHGSDLDVWADVENVQQLCEGHYHRSIFKFLPKPLSQHIIKNIVKTQYIGYMETDTVLYFPTGFNTAGDKVISKLTRNGVKYVQRYDCPLQTLKGQSRKFKSPSDTLEIFSGVRFLYKTFPDGNNEYNKGNDVIIEGIAKYYATNKNIKVHFVEKGEDVKYAKELCREKRIEDVVVWHKEMPFKELLALYQSADICFDQVGKHWISGIGAFALWLGKPLIANAERAVRSGVWPEDNPVCSANSADQIYEWLGKLENAEFRSIVSERSKAFSEAYMSPSEVLEDVFEFESSAALKT